MIKEITSCAYCGMEFKSSVSHINKNKKRGCKNYCSKEHYFKARSKFISGKNNPMYNKKHSRVAIGKIQLAALNVSDEIRKKALENRRRLHPFNGRNNPNYGNRGPLNPKYGKKCPEHSKRISGKNNPAYIDGRTLENRKERKSPENRRFIKDMLRRDNFTCIICRKSNSGKMIVDHIMSWSRNPELRQDPENARTLCIPCHEIYGAMPNYNSPRWATSPIYKPE